MGKEAEEEDLAQGEVVVARVVSLSSGYYLHCKCEGGEKVVEVEVDDGKNCAVAAAGGDDVDGMICVERTSAACVPAPVSSSLVLESVVLQSHPTHSYLPSQLGCLVQKYHLALN